MSIEVEQKYAIADPSTVLTRLGELGAESKRIIHQSDTYYAHPARDFASTDEALRIRRVGESNFVTYKGPKLDKTTKTRREIELPLASGTPSGDGFDELLQALGFRRVADVAKVRQIFHLTRSGQTIELAMDQVKQIGDFIELEIVVADEAAVDAAQKLISELASDLRLADAERRSYLEMQLDG